jgi:imidazoleglycerol-phosphate dehydratase
MAFDEAIGDAKGIARYGTFFIPMDETLAICSVDICKRPYFVFNAKFVTEKIGGMDTPDDGGLFPGV